MRNESVVLLGSIALASTMATMGCSSSGGDSPSGSGGAGGSTQPSCNKASPCGGDVIGTWNVTSSCLNISGDWDVTLIGMGCPTVPVTGSLEVKGTWTAKANGTYVDETTTTGSATIPLRKECMSVSSAPVECAKMSGALIAGGWATADCSKNASGDCSCKATANQQGGIGVISAFDSTSGRYKTADNGLKIEESGAEYSYCVSDKGLSVTPQTKLFPVTGTIVLEKTGSSGTGGAGGEGGVTGMGGATSAGGATGAGGKTGSGGASTGAGGATTGAGGKAGAGGVTTGAGGVTTGAGGKAGAGGVTTGAGGDTGGKTGTGGTTSTAGSTGSRPCDIYAAASMKCVAVHSTVRALFASYTGKLYQVKRASDSKTQDILVGADGFADSAAQDTFCTGTTCVITFVYDQSGNGNDVEAETPDSKVGGNKSQTAANATQEQLTVSGHKVYSLYLKQSQAYWKDGSKSNVPLGKTPQSVYMVTSGKRTKIDGCCFDYGNGPLSRSVSGCGTMDAVNFSTNTMWEKGAGSGPWVMADFECGLKAGGNPNSNNPSMTYAYVTAIEKNNGTSEYSLRGADATTGKLGNFYKGKLPFTQAKEGAIILGSGGDCCYSNTTLSSGTFYEGAIVAGYPSDAIDDAVQENIVAAGYGK